LTDVQPYLAIGIPTFAVVLGTIGNGLLFNALSARLGSVDARMLGIEGRMTSLESRLSGFETSVNQRIDMLIGKVSAMDRRLSILEDRSNRA
jgi:hypothetical protein